MIQQNYFQICCNQQNFRSLSKIVLSNVYRLEN